MAFLTSTEKTRLKGEIDRLAGEILHGKAVEKFTVAEPDAANQVEVVAEMKTKLLGTFSVTVKFDASVIEKAKTEVTTLNFVREQIVDKLRAEATRLALTAA